MAEDSGVDNKGKLDGIFHNEFIRSLSAWVAVGLCAWGMLKFIIYFYKNNELSITFSLAEILIATFIASAVLSVWSFAKAIKTKRNSKVSTESFLELITILEERTSDLNGRLKIIENIESGRFKLNK